MKIIRLYFSFGIALLMLTACTNEPEVNPQRNQELLHQEAQTYTQNVALPPNATEQVVTLTQLQTSISMVENTVSWLTVESQAYISGSPQVKLRSINNPAKEERKCSVSITATSGDKVILSVTQQGGYEGTGIDDLHESQTDRPAYCPHK